MRRNRQNDEHDITQNMDRSGAGGAATSSRTAPVENNNAANAETLVVGGAGGDARQSKSRARHASTDADVFTTNVQLAAGFAVLQKVTDELLLLLTRYERMTLNGDVEQLLQLNAPGETTIMRFKVC